MKAKLLILAIAAAVVGTGSMARASTIDYIFTGDGSGTLNGVAWSGDFTVTEIANTSTVNTSGAPLLSNVVTSATFEAGSLNATLTGTGNDVILNASSTFPSIAFDQQQPSPVFDVGEGLENSAFETYNLATAFPLTAGIPSFIPQTFDTSAGNLAFAAIGSLSFEATTGVPEPASWATMLVGFFGLGGMIRSRRRMAAAWA